MSLGVYTAQVNCSIQYGVGWISPPAASYNKDEEIYSSVKRVRWMAKRNLEMTRLISERVC